MGRVFTDMFTGWKSGMMGRLRFFFYSFSLFLISVASLFFTLTEPNNVFFSLLNLLVALLHYYCGLLLMIKRYRELTHYPVFLTLMFWGIAVGVLLTNSPALAACGLILALILYVAPGRSPTVSQEA